MIIKYELYLYPSASCMILVSFWIYILNGGIEIFLCGACTELGYFRRLIKVNIDVEGDGLVQRVVDRATFGGAGSVHRRSTVPSYRKPYSPQRADKFRQNILLTRVGISIPRRGVYLNTAGALHMKWQWSETRIADSTHVPVQYVRARVGNKENPGIRIKHTYIRTHTDTR